MIKRNNSILKWPGFEVAINFFKQTDWTIIENLREYYALEQLIVTASHQQLDQ